MSAIHQTSATLDQISSYVKGKTITKLDKQAAKVPSGVFFGASLGTVGLSMVLEALGKTEKSHFVGQWVAPFMLLGLYSKLIKLLR